MTLRQFLTECEMFKYSQANYDFMREYSELQLMDEYIENQRFIIENASLVTSVSELVTESFIFESASEDQLVLLESKFTEKLIKFRGSVTQWLMRILESVKNAFKSILKVFKKTEEKSRELLEKINKVTDEDRDAIKRVLDDAVQTSGAPISERQLSAVSKLPSVIIKWKDDSINNKLAAALINTKIQTTIASDGPFRSAIAERHIVKFFDKVIVNLKAEGDRGTESLQRILDRYITESRSKGITVSADSGAIEELIKKIEAYKDKIETINLNKEYKGKMSDIGLKFFEATSEAMAHSISLYRSVLDYRSQVVVGLASILKK